MQSNYNCRAILMLNEIEILKSVRLRHIYGIRHGFFTRCGGVSGGEFETLNCSQSSGDHHSALQENRRRVAARLGLVEKGLVTLHQAHGRRVWRAEGSWDFERIREGDGLVTRQTGIGLGVLSADCAPLLLADGGAGVVGAAHAGWKGALSGVVEAVLEGMCELGARRNRVVAAIGPCIQRDSYQVDGAFRERFRAQSLLDVGPWFADSEGQLCFDLPGYIEARLRLAGIEQIDRLQNDTYQDEARFFSYRRSTHRGEQRYGRQISVILLAC